MAEFLDIVDEQGELTGQVASREDAHRLGLRHRGAHVWLLRDRNGCVEILLQQRSPEKDSFPGCYDISSAGHIPAGVDYVPSAIRELGEELGLKATPEEFIQVGCLNQSADEEFHGQPFHNREVSRVYVLWADREPEEMSLQEEEVSGVLWMEFGECCRAVAENTIRHCIHPEELELIRAYLEKDPARN